MVGKWEPKSTKRKNPLVSEGHTHGQKSETRTLREIGARQVIGSGSIPGMKSDGVLPNYRIECKSTVKESLSIKLGWLQKIRMEALETNRLPILTLSFVTGEGKSKQAGEWALIPLTELQGFLEYLDEQSP